MKAGGCGRHETPYNSHDKPFTKLPCLRMPDVDCLQPVQISPTSNRPVQLTNFEPWLNAVAGPLSSSAAQSVLIGVLEGEGIGPEITDIALQVFTAVADVTGTGFSVERGGAIGCDAEKVVGTPLPDDVIAFCQSIFDRGGAVLNGPGGSRYVYDLRKAFDLYFKISPIQPRISLPEASPIKAALLRDVDLLVVRENISGLYQGQASSEKDASGLEVSQHSFSYHEAEVQRFLTAAARLAALRRGHLTVAYKQHGVPTISALWKRCTHQAAEAEGIQVTMVDVDLMAYQLVSQPAHFDVIAAPNMCGDILADLAAVLLGSRAMSFSGNYTPEGSGVYQTNHGAAYDLAGTDTASPVGQILSLAMMMRHNFRLHDEACAIENGLHEVWKQGWRTPEVAAPGMRIAGTRQMGDLVAAAAARAARARIGS